MKSSTVTGMLFAILSLRQRESDVQSVPICIRMPVPSDSRIRGRYVFRRGVAGDRPVTGTHTQRTAGISHFAVRREVWWLDTAPVSANMSPERLEANERPGPANRCSGTRPSSTAGCSGWGTASRFYQRTTNDFVRSRVLQ